jgi:HAE1 family hydrophobic/amphiphilic exporter-1
MTTVAVFAPLFFISGIVGKFIASIPFTIIFVLMASIFVALGLVPTLANMFAAKEESRFTKLQEAYTEKARVWYAAHLKAFLHSRKGQNRFLIGMIVALVVSFSLPIVGLMKVSFFPGEDGDFIYVNIEEPAGTDLNMTDLATRAVEEKLYGDPRFSSLVTTVGSLSAFSNTDGSFSGSSDTRFANITINLVEDREQTSSEILADVKAELSSIRLAEIRVGEPSGGPPVGAAILIKFLGKDSDLLNSTVARARGVLENTEGATAVDSSNKFDGTQYVLGIDRGKLASVGLSPAQIASALRTAVSGVTATKLTGGDKDVDIVVSLNLNADSVDPHDASHTTIDSLSQIPLTNASGNTVLLGSVVDVGVSRSDSTIVHENRQRVATLSSDVLPGYTPGEVLAAFNDAFKPDQLPSGVMMMIGGENEETNQSFAEMGYALIAGLALMFIILVLEFNSFRYTFYLLSIVPLALIGVFAGLTLVLQPLSFPSMMGIIALAGVLINHGIILVDAMLKRMHTGEGRQYIDIIVEAATTRLRPIVLTTITTVVGMIPLTFASALFGPLALAILFGLSFSTLLTLLLIPTLMYRGPGKLPAGILRENK